MTKIELFSRVTSFFLSRSRVTDNPLTNLIVLVTSLTEGDIISTPNITNMNSWSQLIISTSDFLCYYCVRCDSFVAFVCSLIFDHWFGKTRFHRCCENWVRVFSSHLYSYLIQASHHYHEDCSCFSGPSYDDCGISGKRKWLLRR